MGAAGSTYKSARFEQEEFHETPTLPSQLLGRDRRVEIGLNVIALHDIDDAHHSFECNFLMHVKWNAKPKDYNPNDPKPFYPWTQFHNLGDMIYRVEADDNKGMSKWPLEKLTQHLKKHVEAKPDEPCWVLESTNAVAKFVTTLDLKAFPFDSQELRITLVSNMTNVVNLTHKVDRLKDPEAVVDDEGNTVMWHKPKPDSDKKLTIKCNLEGDTVCLASQHAFEPTNHLKPDQRVEHSDATEAPGKR
jgi:hypothetical protein